MSDDLLALPDPDPDALAAVEPSQLTPADETAASHLVRGILKAQESYYRLLAAATADADAWNKLLAANNARIQTYRMIVRDWMMRTGKKKLQTPWFTASLAQPRTKIVVDDAEIAIGTCLSDFEGKATKTVYRLEKAAFDDLFNADPKAFKNCAHEEQGEAELRIRKREET